MKPGSTLYFTVTNDLNFDQRMIRICTTLSNEGYSVTLVGRKFPASVALRATAFRQKRLKCIFIKGPLAYAEFNIRLFLFLMLQKCDLVCAIDLDTIIPCYLVSAIKGTARVYDAHELFCEMKEVVTRPMIYRCWKRIERYFVPRFRFGYTVNSLIAAEFNKMYGSDFSVVRNVPVLFPLSIPVKPERYILYQGAVNEGRSFETLIPAMKYVDAVLIVCGDGNFMSKARRLVKQHALEHKIRFEGRIPPAELPSYTTRAWAGVTLFENKGLSNYFSLGNRFFDYMHAGIPQVCVDYPLYADINNTHRVALLIKDCSIEEIASALTALLDDRQLYQELQRNTLLAREVYNWQQEEKELIKFYREIVVK